MSHIEKRRNLYYATLKVPKGLQEKMGRSKFLKSLGTPDKVKARRLAAPIVALWQAQLRQQGGEPDALRLEVMRWRETIKESSAAGDEDIAGEMRSLMAERAQELEDKHGPQVAQHFADVALGDKTLSDLHYDEWSASIVHLEQKTQDQYRKDVRTLVDKFAALQDITPQAGRKWLEVLHHEGVSASSRKRMLSCWRSYWRHLESVDAVAPNSFPFVVGAVRKSRKAATEEGWDPFQADDVSRLWQEARQRGDGQLADLVMLGAYTGGRIEELCSIKVAEVGDKSFRIPDAKTVAGIREVPIHSELRGLIKRLRGASKDDYLLSGLTFNKYGDRSNAIGKRFGRLKTKLGHGERHVFHSIRKTLVTLLEDAGISENLAADIVGHEKPRITYGLYSGGASLATKAQALERVAYKSMVGE